MSDLEVISFRPERDQYAWTFGGAAPVARVRPAPRWRYSPAALHEAAPPTYWPPRDPSAGIDGITRLVTKKAPENTRRAA